MPKSSICTARKAKRAAARSAGVRAPAARHLLCAAIAAAFGMPAFAGDDKDSEVFESSFLRGLGQDVDLSRFSKAGGILPGDYEIDLTINQSDRLRQRVQVRQGQGGEGQIFCFRAADIERWGVRVDQLPDPEKAKQLIGAGGCVQVQEIIPGARFEMDAASLAGTLEIPQAYAGRVKRGYVDPKEWRNGINAGILGYQANLYRSNYGAQGGATTDFSMNLNAGVNVGRWRLRHNGTYQNSSQSGSRYNTQNTYALTDVDSLEAKFTAGQYFTPGSVFDSIPFTGVQLASDERMLPESERGFAPVIRGIAQTNAKVSVRQNGNLVYETTVAPGAFVIDDLYATSYAGDLTVTITEADGRTRSFAVPYAAGVEMLRPGTSRFNVAGGVYRDASLDRAPAFVQGHYRRGISNRFTLYGGGIVGQGYGSVLAGAAMATPIGAFGVDATVARASAVPGVQDSRDMSGHSLRASYSKTMASTGTRFGLAAYRFSSQDYLSFNDYARVYGGRGDDVQHERTRFQATVGQSLGDWGDLYLSGSTRQYWDGREDGTTFQAGYSKSFGWGSLNVNLSREMHASEPVDTLMATISIPLGGSANRPLLGASVTHDSDGNSTVQTRVDGTLGETHAVTYSAYVNGDYGNGQRSHGFGASGSYRTAKARLGASYSQGEGYRQVSASASGTVVAHSGGVTFSPDTGDTFALVVAEGAEGARVANGQGIRLDGDGEALTAGVTPYRHNRVGLDPKGLSDDVELQSTSQDVVPRSGAVVRIEYETETGRGLLLTVEGDTVPFGADVVNADGQSVAVVGQGGFIFLRGEHGPLRAVWGQGKNESCQLRYTMPAETATSEERYLREEATCVPGAAPATTAAAGPSTKR